MRFMLGPLRAGLATRSSQAAPHDAAGSRHLPRVDLMGFVLASNKTCVGASAKNHQQNDMPAQAR